MTSVAYLLLIDGLDTVYERLKALKKALAPTTLGRKYEVLSQYTALKVYNKKQNIDKWLNSWRNVYKLAEQLELLDVQGFRPHYDFVRAIKPISSSFVGALKVDLIRKERKNKDALSIIDLIKEFKEHCCIQQASSTSTANNSAFATL
jgi:ERCC4-related helicase